jgi:hypothetical protein
MTRILALCTILCLAFALPQPANAQNQFPENSYFNNQEVEQFLKYLNQRNPQTTKLHTLAGSPGGEAVTVLEIGANQKGVPAIFVGANFEGIYPLATQGALYLAQMLIDSSDYTRGKRWYVLPQPNPDAAKQYFSKVKYERMVNDFSVNNDVDDATNEDGFDDLNSDGFITMMRVKDPMGTHLVSPYDARIMQKADVRKGERGSYKIYSEGIDNDGDGTYNEDREGGINIGISFPHLFPHETPEAGLWSGQSPEVYALMKFIFDRPEIAMAFTLGGSDFCIAPPEGGRKGGANLQKIKVPTRYAHMFDVDPEQEYSMDEIIELMKTRVPPGTEVTPSVVAGFLGLGAAVNPLDEDLRFYSKYSDDYKKYLKGKGFNTERLPTVPAKDGSFELWTYYHLGIPSFSMNLFTITKKKEEQKDDSTLTIETIEKMNAEEFVALDEEKVGAFLKSVNAPQRFTATGVLEMVKSGKLSVSQLVSMVKNLPKPEKSGELSEKEKSMLAYSDEVLEGKGLVPWQTYKHPTLGDVEIGGFVPYLETTPKPEAIDQLLKAQVPWLLQLSAKIPEISVLEEKVTDLGSGIYRLEIFIENKGELPYPIAMGQRNRQPAPVVIVLDGEITFLEGNKRTPIGPIGGNQVVKQTWIVKTDKSKTLNATLESTVFGSKTKQIKIGG